MCIYTHIYNIHTYTINSILLLLLLLLVEDQVLVVQALSLL